LLKKGKVKEKLIQRKGEGKQREEKQKIE